MNLNDIKGAVEDLIEHHGHKPTSTVYLHGENYGINGIDEVDGELYVISNDGKPAVSNSVIDEYKNTIRNIDALCDLHRYGMIKTLRPADFIVNEVVKMLSDLERKVGDIT